MFYTVYMLVGRDYTFIALVRMLVFLCVFMGITVICGNWPVVCLIFLSAAYPAAYGQFQQALAQHATLLPTGQKEGELKGKSSTPSLFISSMHFNWPSMADRITSLSSVGEKYWRLLCRSIQPILASVFIL